MIINKIKKRLGISKEYIYRTIIIKNKKINLIFNEALTDSSYINDYVLKYLLLLNKKQLENLTNYLPIINIKIIKEKEIISNINNGFLIIICNNKIYSCEAKGKIDRGINKIDNELSINGPKDSFTENYNSNLGLIRKRIKSNNLKVYNMTIGSLTKTKIGLLYMNNITNKKFLFKIIRKLKKINIDGIIDSSYLKNSLENKNNFFPTIMLTQRPDKSAMALLEGKIVIICDMSPYVMILPSLFIDFFHTTDDYYQKNYNTTFIRIIRLLAFIIAILTPALYIAVTTRNYNLIPYKLLLILKAGRSFVPFPAFIEALLMIISFEILKESDIRKSFTSGTSISILGGLILGDAAVSAGIVSPIMIIVIAISSIAGLTFSSIELNNAIRIYKIILLMLSTLFGINGVLIGIIYIFYKLRKIKVLGIPYLTPLIPLYKQSINDTFIKYPNKKKKRNKYLTKNIERGSYE